MHAAEVVARHVAEQDVTAGREVDLLAPAVIGTASFERRDRPRSERVFVDGQTVPAQRERLAVRADDDQLMGVGAVVVDGQIEASAATTLGAEIRKSRSVTRSTLSLRSVPA
jgi:hypothetical protein